MGTKIGEGEKRPVNIGAGEGNRTLVTRQIICKNMRLQSPPQRPIGLPQSDSSLNRWITPATPAHPPPPCRAMLQRSDPANQNWERPWPYRIILSPELLHTGRQTRETGNPHRLCAPLILDTNFPVATASKVFAFHSSNAFAHRFGR